MQKVGPSVVAITNRVQSRDIFMNQVIQEGAGSGVIFEISNEGIMIMTNQHVVDKAHQLTVAFNNEDRADAKLIGADPDADLAVIQIERKDIPRA